MNKVAEIIEFWFEGVDDSTIINKREEPFFKWFNGGRKLDKIVKERFEEDLSAAAAGNFGVFGDVPEVRLALILLFDQFSRHIYRNTPKMYAFDDKALRLALRSIDDGMDRQLPLIQRMFVYMPLHHSEDLEIQEISVKQFAGLVEKCSKVNPQNVAYYEYNYNYAKKHRDLIAAEGRFVHRDGVLGRV